jgi:amino acid adenylation domain-containing protein
MSQLPKDLEGSIAVVGLAGRFPGAENTERFWENLRGGVESIRVLSREEARTLGGQVDDPDFVRAVSQPDGIDRFDAVFFGINHREAELLDPQQRIFLETAWEALEDAGCEPAKTEGVIGVFAGATTSTYLIFNLLADPELARSADPLQLLIGNIGDTLATRVSYKLDLKGPSYTVQSACSSSLVAVHNACGSLLSLECDMALAGGVSINVAQSAGYRYQRESIVSPDGHCRAFDARAQGTVFGSGAGVVVLKRIEDAVRDGDTIRAVIRGSAVNNDGGLKVGYTAPSVKGQAEVIAEALGAAGVEAGTISYVEAHGTGTRLGDPIEIQALTHAYSAETDRTGFCAIGSVKSNIGHLDIAAGVAGLIKAVLALEHGQIPPTLHVEEPSPEIDWSASPVYLNTALADWETDGTPRRAGVSSFGIGGTNAHVILEQAPEAEIAPTARERHVLVLSARSEEALARASERLAAHLEKHPGLSLADVAWTLGTGRRAFPVRRFVTARNVDEAVQALRSSAEQDDPLGRQWLEGGEIDWSTVYSNESRRRVPLPTYPFERQRYWIERKAAVEVRTESIRTYHPRPQLSTALASPRNPEEEALAGMWQELLGVAPVGIHDDFFELGGHSLLGTQVIARVRDAFGIDLGLDVLFDAPTVARLAAAAMAAGGALRTGPVSKIPRLPHGPLPLSFGQQRLWFIDRLQPGNPLYNEPRGLDILGPLDVPALAASLSEVVRRHEGLRATFAEVRGEAVLSIAPAGEVPLPVVDLSGLPDGLREAERGRISAEEARRSFDLAAGPLLRLLLLRLAPEEHAAVFNAHHIVTDGWSMGVLVREMGALYAGQLLPALPIQYADFAAWQRGHLAGDKLAELLDWWRQELAGAPQLLALPADRPRPPVRMPSGGTVPFALQNDLAVMAGMAGMAAMGDATPFMVLMAAFQALLLRLTGARDLLVGFPVAGRTRPETEPLIGFFVNTLPLRGRPSPDATWSGLLDQVRTATLGALAHQDLPFERLLDELQVERDLGHTPLVQAVLALHNTPQPELALAGLTIVPWEVHAGTAKFDLTLSLTRTPSGLAGSIEYASDLFDAATIQRLGGQLRTLLQGALTAPETLLADLPLLSEAQRHQLLLDWNDTAEEVVPLPLHRLFEEQAVRQPDRIAVVSAQGSLTYGQLDRQANQLARRLLREGIGPETRVAILLDRSPAWVAAVLGVLKAGGAWVPLDPGLPGERLSFLIADSGAALVITEEWLLGSLPEAVPASPEISAASPEIEVTPDHLAYVIYTSGSTGVPKGVAVTHRGLASLARAQANLLGIGPGKNEEERVLQFSSPSFDASVWEMTLAWQSGAELHLASREALLPGESLSDLLRERGITSTLLPPTALSVTPLGDVPRLRALVVGGEHCPPELAERWSAGRRIVNAYGPTEVTVVATAGPYEPGSLRMTAGRPLANARVHLLDPRGIELVAHGVTGEVCVAGSGLARGYLGRPELTAQRFVPHPFASFPGERLYRTGDLARFLSDGRLEYVGRIDNQVKIRGFRIELGEIQAVLDRHPAVSESRVVVREGPAGDRRLVAYYVSAGEARAEALKQHLRTHLPEYMVPAAIVPVPAWPVTTNGKVDLAALPTPEARREDRGGQDEPRGETARAIARAWQEVLGVERIGAGDNFFDLGGHSLLMPRLHALLKESLGERGRALRLVDLFRFPTVAALAGFLHPAGTEPEALERSRDRALARHGALEQRDRRIAIVGMSGRFPGAADLDQFWENLAAGVESIRHLTAEELAGDPLAADPRHVPAVSMPDGYDRFDALFFGLSHREAELLDPQQRLFLEVAWEALEDAGHDPAARSVGVFAGAALSTYLLHHLAQDEEVRRSADPVQVLIGNTPDSLATRVSYKLNLKGPSYTVQSACSTGLVAVHHACQSLLAGECDVALAGASSLPLGNRSGYLYQEGSIASPDGHCRAFDAGAGGTVFGGGVGAVVLKRLADAEAAGDTIRAVILGTAVNNDGSDKVGYTAPSVTGQAEVISEALAVAGIEPATISYVEAHGTGTPVGDPIEIAALMQVIPGPCAIGSVKTNVGHLDAAAGTAGLIKTALALQHGQIPPSLHFREPNPQIDFGAHLYVNAELAPWNANGTPRRAGVSSFGIGGTNAHVVLEEAPRTEPSPSARKRHLLVLSARSEEALDAATERLAPYLERHDPADIAWTLGTGRHSFPERRFLVAPGRAETGHAEPGPRSVAFLFSGQGSQYPGMGRGLYEEEPVFRHWIDRASEVLGMDLPGAADLLRTEIAQPALFAFEYALAQQWMAWGVMPAALLGHSIGEYVAACLASVFPFEDALRLVALRGKLMQEMPPGAMLAVALPEEELALPAGLSIAAINEPGRTVVAGPVEAIEELERQLDGLGCRRLHTSHAFHSPMMEPVRERFAEEVAKVRPAAPRLPFISNVTGTWITDEQATDPAYWSLHLRAPVRFADGVAELLRAEGRVLLEVGPGNALATLARRQTERVVASTRHPRETAEDGEVLLSALGRLWLQGVPIDWPRLYPGERRLRVPLPTYPFERQRYWIEGDSPRPVRRVAKAASIAEELRSLSETVEDDPIAVARRLQALAEALTQKVQPLPAASARKRHARPRLPTAFIAPRDRTEARIAEIWQDLLGVDEVGIDDDFFALGGHSLLGTQLLSRLNRTFEVKLPIEALFELPTVGGLAARVRNERTQGFEARLVPTGAIQAPLSYAQERLWFLDRLQPGSAAYNVPAVLRLAGDLDVAALRRTFDELVRRHDALRTTFAEVGGEPRQRVAPPGPVPLPVVDLSGLPEPLRERERQRRLAEEAARPFDLARGPLLRLHLLRLDGRDHTLMVDIHHIATDGWSMGVLVQETTVLYEAFLRGLPPPLPELPIRYVDFAAWQRRWLDGPALDAHLDYWRRELAGAPELVEIPADRPRPAVQSYRGDSFSFTLPDAVAEAVRTLARRSGATPFMVLLAGFQTLVHRLAAADDVPVGSPIANRNRVEIEGLIGLFVNTLVFRLRLRGEETFTAVLERVRAMTLAGYAHQDLPFEVLVDALGIPRSLAHNPLFQVMLVLQNAPPGELKAPGLTLVPADPPTAASKLDLTVYLYEKDGDLTGMLEYATDLYDEATLRRLLDHFGNLLAGAGAAPGRRVSDLVLLSESERGQLLRWNHTAAEYPDVTLLELLDAQAGRTPDAVAVVYEERRLTYAELHRAAGRLAAHLRTLSVGPEVLVGIAAERSLEMVVGLLGILQAGGAYVPIDPSYPAERLAGMIEDAGVPVLLTQGHLLDRLPEHGARVVLLDVGAGLAPAREGVNPSPTSETRVEPSHAAYMIFTSGSTGRPKGAVNSHRGIVNRLLWMQQEYGLTPDDRVLQKTPFSFDVSVWEFFWPLLTGARLVIAKPGGHQDPAYLVDVIEREGITTLHFVPSMLQVFAEQPGLERLTSLRRVMASGEALPADLANRFLSRLGDLGVGLHNLYGPTEAAVDVTYHACQLGEERVPIGRPVANTRIHLLDSTGQEVPVGVAGELCIGGVQVGRGYLKRPDLTADRFTPDPFGPPGARFYRTGDLARWLPNGEVEYLGRIDHQVKIRGVRIELGEIETVLARHPAVREAVVLTHGEGADRELVAYLVPPLPEGSKALREHLQASLPEAMVPAAFVFLDAMPLSPNGKADRKALARIEPGREAAAFVAPRTPLEARLADMWQELLSVERVGVEDHFFRLGGHSLMATRLVSRLRETFGVELPLREVFEAPTLAGLAARIEVADPVEERLEAPVPAGAMEAPLSFAQERLWFLDRLQPGSAAYNIPAVLRLTGDLDVEALRRSFDEIVRRHGPLRTTFADVHGEPRQRVSPPASAGLVPLPVIDLSSLSEPLRAQETARRTAEEVGRPFDLAQGPLLRLHLLRLGRREHTLVVNVHHIASDGWSMGILVRETTVLYEAFLQGLPSPLPELPLQYADFAAWQRSWLTGPLLEAHLDSWRRELADAPALVEIPTDRPRPAVQSYRGASFSFSLPDTAADAVRTLARQAGTTPFMVFLAAFQALLHRESGAHDVLVGSPIANRNRKDIEGLIGLFVNTLVFRLRLDGDETFLAVLERVRSASFAGYAHQDLPFELLVDALGIARSLAHNPLFQVMLVLQNAPFGTLRAPGLTLAQAEPPVSTSKLDLTLYLAEDADGIAGAVEYATDLYDESTIRRLIVHFQNLLAAAGVDPGRRLSDLALLSPAEREQLLLWNDTAVEYPDVSLLELLDAQAERSPDAVALVFEERRLTYAELHREAGRLAAHLRSLGVGPEVLVGIAAERSIEMVVGLLGILKAGGAYVPIDPGYPAERLAGMIEDAGVPVLLTQSHLLDRLPEHGAWTVLLDVGAGLAPAREGVNPSPTSETRVDPGHAAYAIFTSGSTGKPKGAVNSHRGIVNRLLWMQQEYGLAPDDRVLQKTPFSFDVSVWEFFWPLITGAHLVVARPGGHQDPAYLVDAIAREGITTLHFVPSMLQVFVEQEGLERCANLRRVMASGEALPADLASRFLARLPGVELHNLYGPTEAAVDVTYHACRPGEERVPIGRPVANTRIHLLDSTGQEVPVGVAGELCIGGVQVGRGYLNRPDLTADRFTPDPFGQPGGRFYRTGDLARWLPEGEIEYLGRIDHQVKIRGVRIELGEIETALCRHPGVRESVVLARGQGADRALVAYLVPPIPEGSAVLREHLQASLPEAMVPSAFVFLDAMPLSPNGKVDRKALPEPEATARAEYVAPRNPVEELLAAIWSGVLGIERVQRVGAEDNFFELGGHSLLGTQVVSRVREELRVELPMRALFESPTLSALARRIEDLRRKGPAGGPPRIEPLSRDGALEVSFSQQRLWFLDRLEPGRATYNIPLALRLEGPLETGALEAALHGIVRRHEALRTTFIAVDGRPYQLVHEPDPAGLPVCDLSGLEPEERGVEARRRIAEEARTPFSLERGPLVRATLLRLGDAEHVLLVTLHHIVSDGWSLPIYVREMASLYEAMTTGKPAMPQMLPELPVQYADYAHWQRRWLQGEALEAELAHWRERLHGLPPLLELPTDRPRPAVRSWRGATRRLSFEGGLARSLHTTARRLGATPFMVMLSAFAALLHRYSSQESFAVGVPVAGRKRVEIEPLIGFFVNTLVLRCDVTGETEVRALVEQLRERVLDADAHQDVPFEKLVEELAPGRSLSHSPLFQVMLAFQNLPRQGSEPRELKVTPIDAANGTSKFDLTLSVLAGEDRLVFDLEHSTELFDGATLDRLGGHLVRLLEGALAEPGRQVADLPLLSPEEERQLVQWNETDVAHPMDVCLHELFEAQVKRSPERQAVVFEDRSEGRSLTYRELDRAAERLALRLQEAGTGPDTVVGVLAERSLEMVVALLAVLKAGGAYLPLDPDYPADRLAFMIADSRVPVVLAQETLLEELPVGEARVLPLAGAAEVSEEEVQRSDVRGMPESLAYVIYTSGSTGRPKGTMVPHRGSVNHMLWMQSVLPLEPSDRVLQKTSFSFDASVWEFVAPLFAGATLVLAPPGAQRDPAAVARSIQESGATILQVVPSLLRAMLDGGWLDGCRSLRRVFCGGEELTEDLAADFFRVSEAELYNFYGPTETSSETTFWPCERDGWRGPVPIGRPLPNVRLHIVDPRLRPVPAGVPGELLIGGVQVTRGYLGRPELTAERFVPDPFSGESGARLYRTGDRVKRRPDGAAEFLGRVDFQIKIRGFRIELGEVESALLAVPGVAEAAVLALGEGADRRLVAYVSGDAGDLRGALKARLPAFMVPSGIVVLDALPLNPNGKVDRKALARIEPPAAGERELVAPRTPAEEMLAGIWGELLGLEHVGAEDQFFELGGHSLLATRLASRVRELFGVEIPLREIFEAPTPAGLALRIEAARRSGGPAISPIVPLVPGMGEDRWSSQGARLSFAQERLWFLDRLQPGSAFYNIPFALRISGALDPAVFAAALNEIVRRHDALRTTFTGVGGEPWQVVAPELSIPLPVIDLSAFPDPETEARLRLAQEAARPFDLETGPLLRALLVKLADEEHVAVLTMHHIVSDGWSVEVLVRELATLAAAALTGRAARLPDLPVQYVDFARWQREWLDGEVLEAQIAHWKEALRGAPTVLELPADKPRPPVQTFRGAGAPLAFPAELAAALRDLGRRQGVTLFMSLLAGFEALLARYTGEEDLLVGSPVANRNRGETEGLIGFFVNNLVLRADLSGDPDFAALLGRVRANALAAYERQDLPFERLVEELGVERSLARNPLFQVVFSLQNAPATRFELPGLTLTPVDLEATTAKTDLVLALAEGGGEVGGVWEYATDLFDRARIERMTGHLLTLLAAAVADPSVRISDLPLLTGAEQRQLRDWNAGRETLPVDTLHETFAMRAAEAPDRTAVVFGDESITYGDLAKRAGRLARHLAKLGVEPETRVGIAAEPGIDRVVAVLAVWMAGGAYVPLDVSYPKERLAFMLEDSAAPVLLAETRLLESLPPYAGKVVPLDAPLRGRTAPLPRVTPDHLAYVIYTSGSTGRPNGVLVRHGSAARLIREAIGHFQVGPESRVLQSVSFSFDASVLETWLALASGATLVIAPRAALLSGEALAETIDRHGITTAVLTPAVLANLPGEELPTLVTASVGGDSCPGELATRWSRRLRLLNCYGPTEATIYATVLHLAGAFAKEPPIGRPVGGTEVHLLDRGGQPVPVGVPGELCIAGEGLARGYLNRPDLTAQRFIPHPGGERLYRTGDLARHLPDGTLEFLGRVDHQVKLRGLRIELGEVEAALARHPAVRECAAAVRGSGSDRHLIAWAVFRDEAVPATDLRAFLRERLPEHMLPAAVVPIEALPLSPTGKVDRAALPDPQADAADRIAPRDPLEHELARLWEEALGTGPIGVRDDFFTLGGHSLLAVRLMSRIEERLGRALPLTALFTAGTVEGMAALLREEKTDGPASRLIPLQSKGARPPFFWVHPAGGDVLCYAPLARHLGGDQPFYGIQADGENPPSRIEEMAERYVQEVRRVQPEGPYFLGGWSLGGAVAFEMAQQLRAAGATVALLAVIDGAPVIESGGPEESDADFLLDIAAYVGNFHGRDPEVSRERLEALDADGQIAYLTGRLAAIDFLPPGAGEAQLRRVLAVYRANARAARRYRPGSYPDGLVLLRAGETPHGEGDLGWSRVVGGPVEIHTVPGNHLTLMAEPNVRALASRLRLCLEQAFAGEMETVFE